MTTTPRYLPRTIRLDTSDLHAFPAAAEEGEWAVSGAFAFADADPEEIVGAWAQAFRNGLLGTESFGWSTFVAVAPIDALEAEQVVTRLARHFVEVYGAPSLAQALPVAREEVAFAASLCDGHPAGTLITVERSMDDSGVREHFRTVKDSRGEMHAAIWEIAPDMGPAEEESGT